MIMRPFTEDEVGSMIINPFYAIVFKDYLFEDHKLEIAKEDWVLKNAQLIKEMGPDNWLEQLLISLSTDPQDGPTYTVINPYVCAVFSERLQGEHEPLVTREMWLQANVKGLQEFGAEKWLSQLLDVLETGGPA